MIPDYPGCEKCPLKDRPPVHGFGPSNPELMVVGEAPGSTEVQKGVPFVGVSGKLLRTALRGKGIDPEKKVYYTNACLCNPIKNATPTPTAVKCCHERFVAELNKVCPSKILAVGGTALQCLLSPGKTTPITKFRGQGMVYRYWIEPTIGESDVVDELSAFLVPTYHPAAVTRDPELFRDFAADIQKVLKNSAPLPPPEIQTILCETPEEAIEYLEEISTASFLTCDLETTGFSPIRDSILSFGFGALTPEGTGVSIIIPQGIGVSEDEGVIQAMYTLLTQYEGIICFHNLKFDLQFLQMWFGVPLQPKFPKDTMLMVYALDERGTTGDQESRGRGYHVHGLKDQARLRYDIPDYHWDFEKFYKLPGVAARISKIKCEWYKWDNLRENWSEWYEMFSYQGMDCYVTARLLEDTTRELNEESEKLMTLVDETLVPGALLFTSLELTGAPVDIPYFKEVARNEELALSGMLQELQEKAFSFGMETFNPQSTTQAPTFLKYFGFVTTSTEREVLLLELNRKNKLTKEPIYSEEISHFVHLLSDYRQRARTLQKDIYGLINRVDTDGRIRPDYLLHEASTGRLACRDPNLQNIPTLMGPIIRDGFIAGYSDYLLLEADESQLELRVACNESHDRAMKKIFETGGDIHRMVASNMFKKPPNQITKYERYIAKYVDFGVIYGRGAKSLTEGWEAQYVIENLGGRAWTLREAQTLLDDFLNGFPDLKEWIENQHTFVRSHKYVETQMGRRRRFPFIPSGGWSSIERQAVNSPIQSFGSDIVLRACIRILPQLPPESFMLPIVVHDSVMFLVRKDQIEIVYDIAKRELETPPIPMIVPLQADFKIGYRWGKMVDYKDYDPQVNYATYNGETSD